MPLEEQFELLKLGLAAAACLFVAIEFARKTCPDSVLVSGVSPFCLKLEPHGGQGESADGNDDAEVVVVSHLLLLLGCALPIWVTQASNSVHAYAGIFALCVVDSSVPVSRDVCGCV